MTPQDVELVSTALGQIESECIQRRKSRGKVGGVTPRSRSAVDLLKAKFEDAPEEEFMFEDSKQPTTLRNTLQRVGTALAAPAPDGCGANVEARATP